MEEVLVFNSLAEAKNQTVNPGEFCFIKDESMNLARLTKTWKESEGSSLPDEVRENPEYGDGILVKVTREKVKLYHLGGGKSFCTQLPYSAAMQSIFG